MIFMTEDEQFSPGAAEPNHHDREVAAVNYIRIGR